MQIKGTDMGLMSKHLDIHKGVKKIKVLLLLGKESTIETDFILLKDTQQFPLIC